MQTIRDRRDHTEVAAAAFECPEQVRILVGTRPHLLAVRRHERVCKRVIARQAAASHQPAHSAAEGEPGSARGRDEPTRGGQPVRLCGSVELAPRESRLTGGDSRDWVYRDPLHR